MHAEAGWNDMGGSGAVEAATMGEGRGSAVPGDEVEKGLQRSELE